MRPTDLLLRPAKLALHLGSAALNQGLGLAQGLLGGHGDSQPQPPSAAPRQDPHSRPAAPVTPKSPAPPPSPAVAAAPPASAAPAPPASAAPAPSAPAPAAPPVPDEVKTVDDAPEPVATFGEEGADEPAGAQVHVDPPWDGYDAMTAAQVRQRLGDADAEVLAAVALYEGLGKGRSTVVREAEGRLAALSA